MIVWSRFSQKGYFWCKAKKVRITIEFCIYKSVLIRNVTSKEQFWYLGANLSKKGYFQSKTEKMNIAIEFCLFNWSKYKISAWNNNFDFLEQLCPKTVLPPKNRGEHHYWVLHCQISLITKLQLETTILIFSSKFEQKRYFGSKPRNVSMTIELCIFRLVYILNFSLKWQFSALGPNLPENSITTLNQKWTSLLNSACSN